MDDDVVGGVVVEELAWFLAAWVSRSSARCWDGDADVGIVRWAGVCGDGKLTVKRKSRRDWRDGVEEFVAVLAMFAFAVGDPLPAEVATGGAMWAWTLLALKRA